ncbi:MAG: 1-acyl-sn-glycerol-3-phosphate acyltransferase [Oscillospiraceae bacterium]|nr:1-acyl-sn-glycerol-3-phosphate acyltransferase [Oscillospiraceae bacterium]
MLLGTIFLLALSAATGICFWTDAFQSLAWLWVFPVSFIGAVLIEAGIVFAVVMLMVKAVDFEKPQEKDSKPYRFVIQLLAQAAVPILSVRMHTEGLEKRPKKGRFFVVCNHLNEMDPVILLRYFPKSQLTFISKQENKEMFVVGPFLHKIQGQFINRDNDRQALRSIIKCIEILREDRGSVAVFPEGYIHDDKKLHRFRSGVFKIAQKTKVPIVVCTVLNTPPVFHNGLRLKKTHVHFHVLDVIQPQEYEAMTTVELGNKVYEMMAADLGPENVSDEQAE